MQVDFPGLDRFDRAIYATGWDGDIVVTARADGTISVATGGR